MRPRAEIDVREAYKLDMRAALVGCVKSSSLPKSAPPSLC